MRNSTLNQQCKGEGGTDEEKKLEFFSRVLSRIVSFCYDYFVMRSLLSKESAVCFSSRPQLRPERLGRPS